MRKKKTPVAGPNYFFLVAVAALVRALLFQRGGAHCRAFFLGVRTNLLYIPGQFETTIAKGKLNAMRSRHAIKLHACFSTCKEKQVWCKTFILHTLYLHVV